MDQVALPPHLEQRAAGDPRRKLELKRLVTAISNALDELSETLRAALVLVVFDGVSYTEAAKILECPEGTVAWRVHEARRRLRDQLKEYLETDNVETAQLQSLAKGAADAR
jgi:RNA polymerase sigma factor (sigma-70 family)